MNVLVTESAEGDAADLVRMLERAGHRVSTCMSPVAACVGLEPGGACPLDTGKYDVMVDVRRDASPRLSVHEYGVLCALRQDLPLVVAGPRAAGDPVPWAVATVGTLDLAAIETIVSGRDKLIAESVQRVVERAYLARVGVGVVTVELASGEAHARVVIRTDHDAGSSLRHALERAARTALRVHDDPWREADIVFASLDPGDSV